MNVKGILTSCASMLQSFNPYSFANVFSHYSYMNGALYNRSVPFSSTVRPNLVDHRYFYDKIDDTGERVGCHTCGISREAVSPMLLSNKLVAPRVDYCPHTHV